MAVNAPLFPTPTEVEASTPATRDRAIDIIRIVSLVGVVVGHTIMAVSTLRDDVFVWQPPRGAATPRYRPHPDPRVGGRRCRTHQHGRERSARPRLCVTTCSPRRWCSRH